MKNISATIERIRELLADAQIEPLAEELNSYHSADLADILQELKEDERLDCFKLIELDKAAEIIEEKDLTPELLIEKVDKLLESSATLEEYSKNARKMAIVDANERIFSVIKGILG